MNNYPSNKRTSLYATRVSHPTSSLSSLRPADYVVPQAPNVGCSNDDSLRQQSFRGYVFSIVKERMMLMLLQTTSTTSVFTTSSDAVDVQLSTVQNDQTRWVNRYITGALSQSVITSPFACELVNIAAATTRASSERNNNPPPPHYHGVARAHAHLSPNISAPRTGRCRRYCAWRATRTRRGGY